MFTFICTYIIAFTDGLVSNDVRVVHLSLEKATVYYQFCVFRYIVYFKWRAQINNIIRNIFVHLYSF